MIRSHWVSFGQGIGWAVHYYDQAFDVTLDNSNLREKEHDGG